MKEKKVSHPLYESLVQALVEQDPALTPGKLFGMPCLKQGKRAALGAYDGGVVFRLEGPAHAQALALEGAELFDPGGKGRPMKAWVVVGPQHQDEWLSLAMASLGE